MKWTRTVKSVALFEGAKGLIVLLAGFGVLGLLHRDLQGFAETLVSHSHINPASRYPKIFIHWMGQLNDANLMLLSAAALVYAAMRLTEAYGLWHRRRWAEYLAAVSGTLYLPIELAHLWREPSGLSVLLVVVNAAIVAVMVLAVRQPK